MTAKEDADYMEHKAIEKPKRKKNVYFWYSLKINLHLHNMEGRLYKEGVICSTKYNVKENKLTIWMFNRQKDIIQKELNLLAEKFPLLYTNSDNFKQNRLAIKEI